MFIDIDNENNDKGGNDNNRVCNQDLHENINFKVMYSMCVIQNLYL